MRSISMLAFRGGTDRCDAQRGGVQLLLHGTRDGQLWPEFAQQAYDAAGGDKELVWLETHNHIELYDQDPYVSEAARRAIRWLDRYLGASREEALAAGF